MGNPFSKPKPKKIKQVVAEPVPTRTSSPAVEEGRRQALIANRVRQGRTAQLVTGAQGVTGAAQAQQARLLGA